MLQFRFANFRSFRNESTFNMLATNTVSKDRSVDQRNIFFRGKDKVLKTSAVYGANASGKSNVVKAIAIMRNLVINSARSGQFEDELPYEPFLLHVDSANKPTAFEIIFIFKELKYRYGFEYTSERITSEWLYRTRAYEVKVFEREGNIISLGRSLSEAKPIERFTRDNALFISILSQFNIEVGKDVVEWFRDINIISPDLHLIDPVRSINYVNNGLEYANLTAQFLKTLDVGIDGIRVPEDDSAEKSVLSTFPHIIDRSRRNSVKTVKTIHKIYNDSGEVSGEAEFDFEKNESDGTRKLFYLLAPLLEAFRYGRLMVVDEIDARLHPNITESIISLFNNPEVNGKCAQILFTTHDTNLLKSTNFRRDQVWFVEKSSTGQSELYSLVDYESRNDTSYEKDYLRGKYGAIPFLNPELIFGGR